MTYVFSARICLSAAMLLSAGASSYKHALEEAKDSVEQQTLVPVRLPSYISHLANEKVYAIIDESTKDKYSIQLAFEPICQGQNVCTIGTMTGSSKELSVSTSKEYDVLLHRGLKGRYTHMLCASYCSNSSIRWKQDGYYYSISLKATNKDDLLDAVNSAVDVALK